MSVKLANQWHAMQAKDVVKFLSSSESSGLSFSEVEKRASEFGKNEIKEKKKKTVFDIFVRQFKSLVVFALFIAAALSFAMEEYTDVMVIMAVLLVNATIGTFQEYRAEKALEALKKMGATSARVIREGNHLKIPARDLVPGDIILLEVGDRVPADARILETFGLAVNESMLTGESVPAKKSAGVLDAKVQVSDRKNMVFKDTIVTSGRAKAIVVSIGMDTEIGKIAGALQTVEETITPLQKRTDDFMKLLGKGCLVGIVVVVLLGTFVAGLSMEEMIKVAIAQTVSFIPEGLPIVLTIVLAMGVSAMAAKNAIIRRLPAVETLGCVTAICTDKTGTLTKNEMTVKQIWISGKFIDVEGDGYEPVGGFFEDGKKLDLESKSEIFELARAATLCNDASLSSEDGKTKVVGDPTEGALLVFAEKAGIKKRELEESCKREGEIQFNPENKYMVTFNRVEDSLVAYAKGAPEKILEMSSHIVFKGKVVRLSPEIKKQIIEANHKMASKTLRVLGFAYKQDAKISQKQPEGLVFIGLAGMIDPLREETLPSIEACRKSGIKVIMITGDHKLTAMGIAKRLNMIEDESQVLTGEELSKMDDSHFLNIVDKIAVYARTSSEHKFRVVNALRQKGHVVAMTGDGVNDALAIKKADVGIAMGISGTEVTKESSDMILTDDNFSTIVAAIEEGRGVYLNLKKVIAYLLATNVGEVIFLFLILLSGLYLHQFLPLAILPIQILWVNLVTNGLSDVTLAMEPVEKGLMRAKPRNPKEPLITPDMVSFIVTTAVLIALGCLVVFYTQYNQGGLDHARTVTFTTLVIMQLFSAMNARSPKSVFEIGFFSNIYLAGAIIASVILQLMAIYTDFMNEILYTTPLTLEDWFVVVSVASTVFITFEIKKFWKNKIAPKKEDNPMLIT